MFTKLFNVFVGSPACGGGYGNYSKNETKLPLIINNKEQTTKINYNYYKN